MLKTLEQASGRSDTVLNVPAFLHGCLPTQRAFPQGICNIVTCVSICVRVCVWCVLVLRPRRPGAAVRVAVELQRWSGSMGDG